MQRPCSSVRLIVKTFTEKHFISHEPNQKLSGGEGGGGGVFGTFIILIIINFYYRLVFSGTYVAGYWLITAPNPPAGVRVCFLKQRAAQDFYSF